MTRLEDLTPTAAVSGILPDSLVTVVSVQWFGSEALKLPYKAAATITVTKNEILYSLNKPEDFILAIVEFLEGDAHRVHYVRQPFQREPDFGVTSVNYDCPELLARAGEPS